MGLHGAPGCFPSLVAGPWRVGENRTEVEHRAAEAAENLKTRKRKEEAQAVAGLCVVVVDGFECGREMHFIGHFKATGAQGCEARA